MRRLRGHTGRFGRCAVLAFCALVSVACQVDADVLVDLTADGGGDIQVEVVLDAETIAELGGLDSVITGDLDASSWEIDREVAGDGSVSFVATQSFANPEEATAVFAEIGGDGLATVLEVERSQEPGRDDFVVVATADVSAGPGALADPDLIELLGDDFGSRLTDGLQDSDQFNVVLRAAVPGADEPVAAAGTLGQSEVLTVEAAGTVLREEPGLARAEADQLRSDASDARNWATMFGIAGVAALLAALGLFFVSRRSA